MARAEPDVVNIQGLKGHLWQPYSLFFKLLEKIECLESGKHDLYPENRVLLRITHSILYFCLHHSENHTTANRNE